MTLSVMLQGTASDVGKSVLVAGLCRILAQDGYKVAPFKAQNMALNSGITASGDEMGRAQIFQAEAAGIAPDVRMNPVLLKPTSDRKSQVILMGRVLCDMDAMTYHDFKPRLQAQIADVYGSLAHEQDVIVLEGAGSPAEINLRERDIVNMGMANLIDAPVILIADIDRGGVFASIYGTLALLPPDERARIKGVIINKFRGDVALLMPGIRQIEDITSVPVLGVMPYLPLTLEDEDGVALQPGNQKYRQGEARDLDVVVIRVPHISNFTDFNALAAQPDVNLRYVDSPTELGSPDLVILPGSKNTLGDLTFLNQSKLSAGIIAAHGDGVPVIGICGGFQMLGQRLIDGVESGIDQMAGLGLLACETVFAREKVTTQVSATIMPDSHGLLAACAGMTVEGYEIHMGETVRAAGVTPFTRLARRNRETVAIEEGAISQDGLVAGTYIHGIFDAPLFTRTLLNSLRERKGLAPLAGDPFDYRAFKQTQFDQLAAAMRQHLDMSAIYHIIKRSELPAIGTHRCTGEPL
ncbi:cobyric acid synthase [Aeromonas sp. MdU4]|uniref:cobyric acid synthase n=1 Tax=Aeromonas sp. MdU4 TaxID=3342819 RepID=UPI0035B848C4